LPDGKLHSNGANNFTGSIHQVGKQLKDTPSCNGWKHWYYQDEKTLELLPIDNLRQQYRAEMRPD